MAAVLCSGKKVLWGFFFFLVGRGKLSPTITWKEEHLLNKLVKLGEGISKQNVKK